MFLLFYFPHIWLQISKNDYKNNTQNNYMYTLLYEIKLFLPFKIQDLDNEGLFVLFLIILLEIHAEVA